MHHPPHPEDRADHAPAQAPLEAVHALPLPATKRCTACSRELPLAAFGRQKGGRFGLHPRCRQCRSAQEKARYRANREAILERQRTSERRRDYTRWYKRAKKYGVSRQEFETLRTRQQGRCAICGELADPLCVDHDHETGAIRGLLCNPCNVGIGYLRDDPVRLRAAARYLAGAARPER